ncbi:MAG: redoxin domain-containing protein [Nitrosomonadales bacterium]|nr:redoxin domain-containing protein [Nitrosomonadales bacterium]
MNDSTHIVCPHCDGVNHVSTGAIAEQPVCDECRQPLFTAHSVELNENNFVLHISRNDIPVLVDFWSPSCGPCRMMAPAYEKIAQRLEPGLRVTKLNMDEAQQIAAQYNIQYSPTQVLFKAGREVARRAGAIDAVYLEAWVKAKS